MNGKDGGMTSFIIRRYVGFAFASPCCSVHMSSTCHSLHRELEVFPLFVLTLLLLKLQFFVFSLVLPLKNLGIN